MDRGDGELRSSKVKEGGKGTQSRSRQDLRGGLVGAICAKVEVGQG